MIIIRRGLLFLFSCCLLPHVSAADFSQSVQLSLVNYGSLDAQNVIESDTEVDVADLKQSKYNLGSGRADAIQFVGGGAYAEYLHFRPDSNLIDSRFNRMSSYSLGVAPMFDNSAWFEDLGVEGVALYFTPRAGLGVSYYYSTDTESYAVKELVAVGGELGLILFESVKLGVGAVAQCIKCLVLPKNQEGQEDESDWSIYARRGGAIQYGFGLSVGILLE